MNKNPLTDDNQSRENLKNAKELSGFLCDKIVFTSSNSVELVDWFNIVSIEADRSYSKVNVLDEKTIIISKPLSSILKMVKKFPFFRTHKSHAINLIHVRRICKKSGSSIEMTDGKIVPLTRNRFHELKTILDSF